jgi:anaphase-promoting complex subunit 1
VEAVSGVELDLDDFTNIRFGQDRRLEEVARMLCSSTIPSVRVMERPELKYAYFFHSLRRSNLRNSEHDQAKEHQHQVLRIAERTLALPYGRAMFTFGSLATVTREAYNIPKIEYSIRLQPLNLTVSPEAGKLPTESVSWGEFHNGVAAGLRISPSAGGVESSWIAFNKPTELTPEHAGFLFALGLTGHLKEMLTWHTFGYLTPKHDLTSIGVLLGLSAANVGSGDQHVTKLLAVHTPALLPTPTVDLNVPLMTQAAGIAGVGLLYMGTKNRRMAEVCLNEISRRDLVQPDLSNEYREAYTFSAALSFGMIMLGKGSMIPADMALLSRLNILIHGEAKSVISKKGISFDLNLTSPAATLALGLMYLRTERQDVADMLTVPDTVLALNRIQPSFLLMRVLAKALIMWNSVAPTSEWQAAQIPTAIREAVDNRQKNGKPIDDALELAYYNILASSCFVIGLKFAGTARQEAYMMIIRYFDLFTRMVYSNSKTHPFRDLFLVLTTFQAKHSTTRSAGPLCETGLTLFRFLSAWSWRALGRYLAYAVFASPTGCIIRQCTIPHLSTASTSQPTCRWVCSSLEADGLRSGLPTPPLPA